MMKTLFLTSVLTFITIGLFAQTTLTQANNALLSGDSFTLKEIQSPDPGSAGASQIWDYSLIQYTGNTPVAALQDGPVPGIPVVGVYNLSMIENGYDYFMNLTPNQLEEMGYMNAEKNLTLVYSDPVITMKYPFAYGDQFTDHFIGVATYSATNTIDFFGDYRVAADAYGTLIMPDKIIDNTLRIKTVKTGLQINMCGTTEVNIVKYMWYAAGYRYPVLTISTVENKFSGGTTQVIQSAFTNTQQLTAKSALVGSRIQDQQIVNADVKVVLSPNPFSNILLYSYRLPAQTPVSIELYDMAGKHICWLVKNQPQTEGLHTGELDAATYGLTPGVYFMRFAFDKQVIIRKVVKM